MHVVTFYSFKGGVGRTLALANVGVELAQTGRRVLLVDFDLEAPGLHTFEALQPRKPEAGILELVDDYVTSNVSPDVRNYVYEAMGIGQKGGRLWVMPAGLCDRAYQGKLAHLDWKNLYAKHNGFLLFEDLKAQWKTAFQPDYVLIDSRTGHTDVQGICTRQLPDAVVVLFFPNKQNLDGLEGVVADIREEENESDGRKIKLYFVMSNVPDLDDEEEILKQRRLEFRNRLHFGALTSIIHRYDSLTLLNQAIFTRERPRSRLAKEYRKLRDAIVQANLEDREGAIEYLSRAFTRARHVGLASEGQEISNAYDRIAEKHSQDGAVLFWLGLAKSSEGSADEALLRLDQAAHMPNLPEELRPTLLIERADIRLRKRDIEGAREDALASLELPHSDRSKVNRAVRLLRGIDDLVVERLADSAAIQSLGFDDKLSVFNELSWSCSGMAAAAAMVERAMQDTSISVDQKQNAQHQLSLAYIALGRFREAARAIEESLQSRPGLDIANRFNLAMANWGLSRRTDAALFKRVLDADSPGDASQKGANYNQCIAITFWVIGESEEAVRRIRLARERVSQLETASFNCWRYLITPRQVFLADCDEIQRLIKGESILPLFMREASDSRIPGNIHTNKHL